MTPEVISLLRDWGFGLLLVALTLIWAVESCITAFVNRGRRTVEQTDDDDDS